MNVYNLKLDKSIITEDFLNSIYKYYHKQIKTWNNNTYKSYGIWDQNDTRFRINSSFMNCTKISKHHFKNEFNFTVG